MNNVVQRLKRLGVPHKLLFICVWEVYMRKFRLLAIENIMEQRICFTTKIALFRASRFEIAPAQTHPVPSPSVKKRKWQRGQQIPKEAFYRLPLLVVPHERLGMILSFVHFTSRWHYSVRFASRSLRRRLIRRLALRKKKSGKEVSISPEETSYYLPLRALPHER
jgi:hypothetical protein